MGEPRLMQFVSESKLQELKATRGATVADGTLAADKPLHEILKANKDKHDKEFKDRFKHRPPKALDDEEMEFLENVEMVKRKQELEAASEEAKALCSFHEAVANKVVPERRPSPKKQAEPARPPKRPSQSRILANVIITPQPQKKAKTGAAVEDNAAPNSSSSVALAGLVAYGDDSDDE